VHRLPPLSRLLGGLAVFIIAAFAVTVAIQIAMPASGGFTSSDAARVNGTTITVAQVKHWMPILAAESGVSTPIPDAPTFTKCIATEEQFAASQKKPVTPSVAQQECQTAYGEFRGQALQYLVSDQWGLQGAAAKGVKIPDSQVNSTYQQQVAQAFKTPQAYQAYLAKSGMTADDVKARIRDNLTVQALETQLLKGLPAITTSAEQKFYQQHIASYHNAEGRTIELIVANGSASAAQAQQALLSGQSWASVAAKYSTDPSGKKSGGVLTNLVKVELTDSTLSTAAFAKTSTVGKLVGPLRGSAGYYLLRVMKVIPHISKSFAQAQSTLQGVLNQQQQQTTLKAFASSLASTYRSKTTCLTSYYVSAVCGSKTKG